MEFQTKQPIYLQISDMVCENIVRKIWKEGSRIPSVRELAVETEVNPNTIMRSYSHLQSKNILDNRRGLGYFVAPNAAAQTRRMKRRDFIAHELPRLFRTMELLEMDLEQLREHYLRYQKENQPKGSKHEDQH